MTLVQIIKLTGTIERVKPGVTPVIELQLEDNQRVVSVDLGEKILFHSQRKTTDWHWTAYVETRL